MKKILLVLSVLSCTENKSENIPAMNNAVENAESKISYTRFSKGQNMLDAIYHEQIKNDEYLKSLDEKITSLQKEGNQIKNMYDEILNKSSEYYLNAESEAKSINDSVLRKEILNLVKRSSDNNDLKEKKLRELFSQVYHNNQSIYSQYSAFKIKKTLPEIEKYQTAHPLNTDSLDYFIKKQNALLNELKNLK
ncbi:hypothetical protein HNP38_000797 [Chryseobacterium defluvii]|uniref:Uncharacterized protein n=1 Tax=Chryseobacterium defluvii TaxID=160396 RepID=A0A840KAQ9_9FLAO|nr:hypothetical protein [Chryseobacterium defluvii]MBB4805525.1 hypothetical protein [Chryseobacterium defluvii]